MHPFERNARKNFERNAQAAAQAIGCDVAHVIALAAEQMRVLAENVEKGRSDDPTDLITARQTQETN